MASKQYPVSHTIILINTTFTTLQNTRITAIEVILIIFRNLFRIRNWFTRNTINRTAQFILTNIADAVTANGLNNNQAI